MGLHGLDWYNRGRHEMGRFFSSHRITPEPRLVMLPDADSVKYGRLCVWIPGDCDARGNVGHNREAHALAREGAVVEDSIHC